MLQIPGATAYMGSIGKDKFGEEMKKKAAQSGVKVSHILSFSFLKYNYHVFYQNDFLSEEKLVCIVFHVIIYLVLRNFHLPVCYRST